MFSHKHYEAIAYLIGDSDNLEDFKAKFLKYAKADNDNFNTARFLKAVSKARS